MTPKQVKFVRGLMRKAGVTAHKDDITKSFSGGRTNSLSELTYKETSDLIDYLKGDLNIPQSAASRMRRKILSMAHEMGWEMPDGSVDMDRVNAWCVKYGHNHKRMDQYSKEELPALVSQFENAYKCFIKGI